MKFAQKEMPIRFINYIDKGVSKWCHARIEDTTDKTVCFRTTAYADLINVNADDVKEICQTVPFTENCIKALYRGEILEQSDIKLLK